MFVKNYRMYRIIGDWRSDLAELRIRDIYEIHLNPQFSATLQVYQILASA